MIRNTFDSNYSLRISTLTHPAVRQERSNLRHGICSMNLETTFKRFKVWNRGGPRLISLVIGVVSAWSNRHYLRPTASMTIKSASFSLTRAAVSWQWEMAGAAHLPVCSRSNNAFVKRNTPIAHVAAHPWFDIHILKCVGPLGCRGVFRNVVFPCMWVINTNY